jgi:hypothetical protein
MKDLTFSVISSWRFLKGAGGPLASYVASKGSEFTPQNLSPHKKKKKRF